MTKLLRAFPWNLFAAAVLLTLGALARGCFMPEPATVYRDVEVPVEVIRTVERVDTIVEWKERIVYRTVEAETRATAPGGAAEDVTAFCAEAVAAAVKERSDTVQKPTAPPKPAPYRPPVLLLRSVRTDPAWFFGRDEVIATGPTSHGDLRQLRYKTWPGWQARVMGDSLLFQEPRWGLARQVAEAAVFAGVGYLIGRVF